LTYADALCAGRKALASVGIETAALDAAILLANAAGCDREHIALLYASPINDNIAARFQCRVRQRLDGYCIAYITGFKSFRTLTLAVTNAVLVPRPETETLVEAALIATTTNATPAILDLCTGSGAIALAIAAEKPSARITASDISPTALAVAQHNANTALKTNSITAMPTLVQSDLFDAIAGVFDIIVANPPYIQTDAIASLPIEVRREPRIALDGGADGLTLLRRIITDAPAHLARGGALFVEASPEQMPTLATLFAASGFMSVSCHRDLAGQQRVIGGYLQ
jgi:release factor glutamine methyltransferase